MSPPGAHFGMSLLNGHLQRRVGHLKRDELLPVLRARQSPGGLQPFVKRRRGQWGEQAEDGQPRRPSVNLFKCPLRDTYGIVVHAENKGSDGVNIALGEPLEHGGIFTWLIEPLVHIGKISRVDGLHADKDPLAAGGGNEVHELLVAQKISADLRNPVDLGTGSDNVAQKGFRALDIDGEIIVDEEYGDLATFTSRPGFQKEQLIYHAFVAAKADGVAKKTGHRAKFAAIRAAAPRLHRNDAKCAPALTDALKRALGHSWNQIKLVEIYFVPRNRRILLETGFAFLAKVIHRSVDILELAACGILYDLWPGFIGFTEGHRVCMARPAVSTEGFVGLFRNVRSAHHDRHTNGTDRIGHAVGLGDHAGHRADANK